MLINLILLAIVSFLVYLLVQSIREPIAFKAVKDAREAAVVDKLMQIRQAQETVSYTHLTLPTKA